MNTISEMIVSVLQNRGYTPEKTKNGNKITVHCVINVSAVTFLLNDDRGVVEFANFHSLIPAATKERLARLETILGAEKTPFTDVVYEETEDEHLLFLAGRVAKDEFTADTVNAIADTVERKDGIVATLKAMSHTNKEYRSAEDLAEGRAILDRTLEFFNANGYAVKRRNEDTLQVDCEIGGGSLAVTCEGTEYTFGIDCLFFTDKPLSAKEAQTLTELFATDGTPFRNLHIMDEGFSIEAEYPYSEFSQKLLKEVVEFLTRKDGFAEAARKLSEG